LTNFSLHEVSTVAYDEQQTHLGPVVIVVDHGVWPMDFNDNKNRLKNLVTSLFSLRSNEFVRPASVGCLNILAKRSSIVEFGELLLEHFSLYR
jgi:hypothetical protein